MINILSTDTDPVTFSVTRSLEVKITLETLQELRYFTPDQCVRFVKLFNEQYVKALAST